MTAAIVQLGGAGFYDVATGKGQQKSPLPPKTAGFWPHLPPRTLHVEPNGGFVKVSCHKDVS